MTDLINLAERITAWSRLRRERSVAAGWHYRDDADVIAGPLGNLITEYRLAAGQGADRQRLGAILEAIAGCELATAYLYQAMGERIAPGHAEATRLSGLLVQEISYCAREGVEYLGVRHREFERQPIAGALRYLALAYAARPDTVGLQLTELMTSARGVIPGQPTETLALLTEIHGGAR